MTLDGIEYAWTAVPTTCDVPNSHKEAMASPERDEWTKAEEAELASLKAQNTWTMMEVPAGRKPIGSRWTYAKKTDAEGKVVRYKARLVCKGYSQVEGVDYDATFSPVVRVTTIRIVLALIAYLDLVAEQGDADNAFVQASMPKDTKIYVKQADGYEDGTERAMLLNQALYGLKQAALAWYDHCRKIMIKLGFRPSDHDPCLYTRGEGINMEIVCTYVDDFIVAAKTQRQVDGIFEGLLANMKLKRQGELHHILGIKIVRDRTARSITASQPAYARKVLARFNMANSSGKSTPEAMDDGSWDNDKALTANQEEYRSIVGSLMYLMTCTRPDIAHAVQRLSRYLHDPREAHMIGAKRALRYLKSTLDIGITYMTDKIGNKMTLLGYGDASWGNRPDRKSTSGYVLLLLGGPVSWKSSRQKIVALSTCEAEYVAAADAAKEIIWIRGILRDLGQPQETTILNCDNKAAIVTAQTASTSERSKHIEVRHHFIRALIEDKTLNMIHCGTADMWADILTKISTKFAIEKFLGNVMSKVKQAESA
jgi:hypothetical protein